jgi:hypothetical protein
VLINKEKEVFLSAAKQSGTKAFSPFCPTTLQYQPPFRCGHAGTKAVSALAFQHAGLKCTFHGLTSSKAGEKRARNSREMLTLWQFWKLN